jgi:hypothetical protein
MLQSEECGRRATTDEEARRWRAAYLTVVDDGDSEEVVVYAPTAPGASLGTTTT